MTAAIPDRSDLDDRLAGFTAVVDAVSSDLPADAWTRPSPCDGWSAADVVDHVVATQRDFLGQRGVDLGVASTDSDPARRWADHVGHLTAALTPEVWQQPYAGFFGPTTVGASLLDFYGFDLIVHRWDLATAVGAHTVFSAHERAALTAAMELYGDTMYTAGICGPAVEPPAGADEQTQLLARTGRVG